MRQRLTHQFTLSGAHLFAGEDPACPALCLAVCANVEQPSIVRLLRKLLVLRSLAPRFFLTLRSTLAVLATLRVTRVAYEQVLALRLRLRRLLGEREL